MLLSNKVVSLDLAPFCEKVENHWCILCRSRRHAVITRLESRNCSSLLCELRGQQSIKKGQSCRNTCVRDY